MSSKTNMSRLSGREDSRRSIRSKTSRTSKSSRSKISKQIDKISKTSATRKTNSKQTLLHLQKQTKPPKQPPPPPPLQQQQQQHPPQHDQQQHPQEHEQHQKQQQPQQGLQQQPQVQQQNAKSSAPDSIKQRSKKGDKKDKDKDKDKEKKKDGSGSRSRSRSRSRSIGGDSHKAEAGTRDRDRDRDRDREEKSAVTPTPTSASTMMTTIPAGESKERGAPREKEGPEHKEAGRYLGMYRYFKGAKKYKNLLYPINRAFYKDYPWPPKREYFHSSGYYFDWDEGDGDLKKNEIMLHNLPEGIRENEIHLELPQATKLTVYLDGTARVEFQTAEYASSLYNSSKMLKLDNRNLGWIRPDELYVLSVPPGINGDDITSDFPDENATNVTFQDGPDGKLLATVQFWSADDAAIAYEDATYNKLGNHQLAYALTVNPLKVTNLPSGITEPDLKKVFQTAKKMEFNSARFMTKIYYEKSEEAVRVYDESDLLKFGKPKLGWLRPEEIYILDVPKDVTDKDLLEDFPKGKKVVVHIGEGWQRIATIIFHSESDQKRSYDKSDWQKLGPQKLRYSGTGHKKSRWRSRADKNKFITVLNVYKGLKNELKKKFPGAKKIKIDKRSGTARVKFKKPADLQLAYVDTDLADMGNKTVVWVGPEELIVENISSKIKDDELLEQFPRAKRIKWLPSTAGGKVAIIIFQESDRKQAFESGSYKKLGPQRLGYISISKKDSGYDQQSDNQDAEMLKKWESASQSISDVSKIFSGTLQLSNLPLNVKISDISQHFPAATSIKLVKEGKRRAHVYFDDPAKAVRAFGVAKKLVLWGQPITVHILKGGREQDRTSKGGSRQGSKNFLSGSNTKSRKQLSKEILRP